MATAHEFYPDNKNIEGLDDDPRLSQLLAWAAGDDVDKDEQKEAASLLRLYGAKVCPCCGGTGEDGMVSGRDSMGRDVDVEVPCMTCGELGYVKR